ncbi:hypothetical protein PTTG_30682, partial [Puccinia triticina 1-1 BBBD Race 1]
LKNPIKQPHKGCPKGAGNKSKKESLKSTKRDPSAWEYQQPKKKAGRPAKTKSSTGEPGTITTAPKRGRGRPRKLPNDCIGTKRSTTSAVKSKSKRLKRSISESESSAESSDSNSDDEELPADPLEVVTRSGRVVRPSNAKAT